MTIRVAVAGVTNGLGHAIASGLLEHPDIEAILLTRQSSSLSSDLSELTSRGAILKPVDYASIPDLVSALSGVETVISTIFHFNDTTPTLNLIQAAQTAGVRRFAPSEFALSSTANDRFDLYAPKRQIWDVLKQSSLETTRFQLGIFMDYFSFGAPKRHEGPFRLMPFVVNIASQEAAIPGTGEEPMTFTSVRDVGRLVAAAVKLRERWPEELEMVGETTTFNQVVRDAETVTGRKINVQYMDKAVLATRLEELKGDEMQFFYHQVLYAIADGLGAVSPILNRLVPDVSVTSVKEFIAEYWTVA